MLSAANDIKCFSCGEFKKPKLFYSEDRKAKKPRCRACSSTRSSILYSQNNKTARKSSAITSVKYRTKLAKIEEVKQKRKKIRNKQYALLKNKVFKVLGSQCKRCKIKDRRVLQIDHIAGGGTRERKKHGSIKILKKILDGEKGYQLLCANCNWIKKFNKKEK